MSIETDLYSTLSSASAVASLVGTKIYPRPAPESATNPMITYFTVSGTRINTLPGVGDMIRKRIQINCHANSYANSKTLAAAVITALEGNGYLELEYDLYDETTGTFTVIVDWSFLE